MSKKESGIIMKLSHWLHNFLEEELHKTSGIRGILQRFIRITLGSIRKFLDDEGLLRAASISYSLIVSFVPIMVVILLVGAKIIEKESYFLYAREFIRKHGIPLDPDPYFNIINELLNNANAVTGVGFLVLLFSATSVLRNLEAAVNTIWKVKKGRPLVQKISGFLLVLIFGPVLVTVGFSMGQNIVNYAAAPSILSFETHGDSLSATGEKSLFMKYINNKWVNENVVSKIDFSIRKETILFNSTSNTIISGEEKDSLLPKMYQPRKSDIRMKTFKGYQSQGRSSWIITENGCILRSQDREKTWNIQCYQRENTKLVFNVKFSKIKMINSDSGFIFGNNGLILKTSNGGDTWIPAYRGDIGIDIKDFLELDSENFIIIGDNFSVYRTSNAGDTWQSLHEVEQLKGKDRADLISIRKFNNQIWITGDYGTLLLSENNGKTWSRNNLGISRFEYKDIFFVDKKTGILIGENGFAKISEDGGNTWHSVDLNSKENLNHLAFDKEGKTVFIAGDEYEILKNKPGNIKSFILVQKSPFGRSVLFAVGNFVLPFLVIGLIFFIIYKILPYTEVLNKAAFYGAAVTSLLWVLFLLLFKFYVSSFSKGTFAIYGTLAAIPLLLLLVYISAAIMLYGAEVGFFVQNPGLLRIRKNALKIDDDKRQIWFGLKMLYTIYGNFNKGKGSTKEAELIKICHNDYLEFYYIINKFLNQNILEITEKKTYTPVVSAGTILMKDLIGELDPVDYHVPDSDIDPLFKNKVDEFFQNLKKSQMEISGNQTFEDFFAGK